MSRSWPKSIASFIKKLPGILDEEHHNKSNYLQMLALSQTLRHNGGKNDLYERNVKCTLSLASDETFTIESRVVLMDYKNELWGLSGKSSWEQSVEEELKKRFKDIPLIRMEWGKPPKKIPPSPWPYMERLNAIFHQMKAEIAQTNLDHTTQTVERMRSGPRL